MDSPHLHEPVERWLRGRPLPFTLDLERSHDSYAAAAGSGALYLDFFGFGGSRTLAYNHPRLSEPAFLATLARAAAHNPECAWVLPAACGRAVERLALEPLAGEFPELRLVADRSAAVALAVEIALAWRRRRHGGRSDAGQIVTFHGAGHGQHGLALALSDPDVIPGARDSFGLDWLRVQAPTLVAPVEGGGEAEVAAAERRAVQAIEAAVAAGSVAGILVEPIQGPAGERFFRSELLHALRYLADEAGLLLLFDETECGFGATGHWWDWQYHGVKPDLLIFGGRAPVAGLAATERVGPIELDLASPAGVSAGPLVNLLRLERIVDIILADGLLAHAATMGAYLTRTLRELAVGYPMLGNIRSRGLCTAMDLPSRAERDRLVLACFEHELLVASAGATTLRFRPALDVTADAIGRAAAQLEAGLKRTYGRKP